MLFKTYIVLTLSHLYEKVPLEIRFDNVLFEKLTGFNFTSEEESEKRGREIFYSTIDWLADEGYVRCSSRCVVRNMRDARFNYSVLVLISEKGIKHLETNCGQERLIDKFRSVIPKLVGKVAESVVNSSITSSINEAIVHLMG